MKKFTQTLFIACLAIIMCFGSLPTTAFAAENAPQATVTPRLMHIFSYDFSFIADSEGGHTNISYTGYSDSIAKVDVHVKLQKKFLLVFWTDVDEWSTSSSESYDSFYHCFTLDGTGTYKATLTFTSTGIDGTSETITEEAESKYSN